MSRNISNIKNIEEDFFAAFCKVLEPFKTCKCYNNTVQSVRILVSVVFILLRLWVEKRVENLKLIDSSDTIKFETKSYLLQKVDWSDLTKQSLIELLHWDQPESVFQKPRKRFDSLPTRVSKLNDFYIHEFDMLHQPQQMTI